jgi:hypothetical protein
LKYSEIFWNIEANAILYYTMIQGLGLAEIPNDNSTMARWAPKAETLKKAANDILWNASAV